MKSFAALMFLVACGGGGGGGDTADAAKSADAHIFSDAPPVVPQMIKFAGVASESGQNNASTPLAGVVMSVFASSNEATPLATATTDAAGAYSFMVPTNGTVIDGYLKATKSGYADNYVYPAAPFQGDQLMADANLITSSNFGLLGILGGQSSSNGLIVAEILDSGDASVTGATVASTPASGSYRYSDSGGTPTSTTGTNTDGASFMFNVPPGHVDISATKSGAVFKTHGLVAHANAFTTTVITE